MADTSVPLDHSGLVIVDKPQGMTSHDVVSVMRKAFNTRKVGHAGTLDPAATGVLIVGIGRATKLLGLLQLETKSYETTIVLGASTTTEDADGDIQQVTQAGLLDSLDEQKIKDATLKFVGEIQQVPSAVSAIKVAGVRSYERVRRGESVELKARPVTITKFQISDVRRDEKSGWWQVDAVVDCSSGTYIRALARDFGAALGVDAHVQTLRRTSVGTFTLANSRPLEYFRQCIDSTIRPELSLSLDEATQWGRECRQLTSTEAQKLALGQRISLSGQPGIYAAVDGAGRTIALLEETEGGMRFIFVVRPSALS